MVTVTSSTVAPTFNGLKSLLGRLLTRANQGNLGFGFGAAAIPITNPCCRASIAVSDESTNVRTLTIQLQDALGNDINYVETVKVAVFSDATRTAFATGGSTGLAIGTDGALLAIVAKKLFIVTSESDGDIDLTWTDTGTESVSVALYLPNGNVVTTAAFANT